MSDPRNTPTTIRVIETERRMGGQASYAYIFCLPEAQFNITHAMHAIHREPDISGVLTLMSDAAGVLVYLDRDKMSYEELCEAVTSRINETFDTHFVFDAKESIYWVERYGDWEGAVTISNLQSDAKIRSKFFLPYMIS